MRARTAAVVLYLGAVVAPCAGFNAVLLPTGTPRRSSPRARPPLTCVRPRAARLFRDGNLRAPAARHRLSMALDEAAIRAAAQERAAAREAAMAEKQMARQARERNARDGEREKDRLLVMGGGAAFVAARGGGKSGDIGVGAVGFVGLNPDAVSKNLEIIAAGKSTMAPNKVAKALKKRSGQMSVALEYKRLGAGGEDDELNHVDFRRYSVRLRESKLDALFVDTTTPCGLDDCARFVQEQNSAKGSFPGPVPVISTGATTVLHVAEAKALGCLGVMIAYSSGNGDELVKAALSLALEPIAIVATDADVASSVAAGAKILCTAPHSADTSPADAAAAALALKAKMPKDVVTVAGLDSHVDGPPAEIFSPEVEQTQIELGLVKDKDAYSNFSYKVLNYAAALRDVESDNGPFNAIVAMTAVQSAGLRVERNYGTWLLEKLLSKKSTSFNIGEGTLGLS